MYSRPDECALCWLKCVEVALWRSNVQSYTAVECTGCEVADNRESWSGRSFGALSCSVDRIFGTYEGKLAGLDCTIPPNPKARRGSSQICAFDSL